MGVHTPCGGIVVVALVYDNDAVDLWLLVFAVGERADLAVPGWSWSGDWCASCHCCSGCCCFFADVAVVSMHGQVCRDR